MLENVNDIIVSMYQKGFDVEQIAEIFETDIQNISYYLGSSLENRKKSDIITPAVCSMFQANESIGSIAKHFGVSRGTIRFILRKEGLQEYLPTPEEIWIILLHEEGLSYRQIEEKVGLKANRIGQILRRNGISTEKKTRIFNHKRYHFNEKFFDKVDTEGKAYWLGFLYADGYVTNRGVVSLALARKDKEHVVKFASALELDKEPIYYHNTRSYRIDVCSKHMADTLNRQGCLQKKIFNPTFS